MKLTIQTSTKNYPIYIGDVITTLKDYVTSYSQLVVITDQTVYDLHFEMLKSVLPEITLTYIITPGEASKSMDEFHDIQTALIKHRIDRRSLVLAFGGGVVGDLAGFVAATYMRGIDFIQVPTTLLAHDSAIGGKVAINHELGKNLIGAFYQPVAVVYHTPFLETLTLKEWRSGFGEMIKHGFIADEVLLNQLLAVQKLPFNVDKLLIESLNVKKEIVAQDEFETGSRAYLNFGHTLGHALEKAHPSYAHGEAVAMGIAFMLFVSQSPYLEAYVKTLQQLEFPMIIETEKIPHYINYLSHDKKNISYDIRFVTLEQIQNPSLQSMSEAKVSEDLIEFIAFLRKKEAL